MVLALGLAVLSEIVRETLRPDIDARFPLLVLQQNCAVGGREKSPVRPIVVVAFLQHTFEVLHDEMVERQGVFAVPTCLVFLKIREAFQQFGIDAPSVLGAVFRFGQIRKELQRSLQIALIVGDVAELQEQLGVQFSGMRGCCSVHIVMCLRLQRYTLF